MYIFVSFLFGEQFRRSSTAWASPTSDRGLSASCPRRSGGHGLSKAPPPLPAPPRRNVAIRRLRRSKCWRCRINKYLLRLDINAAMKYRGSALRMTCRRHSRAMISVAIATVGGALRRGRLPCVDDDDGHERASTLGVAASCHKIIITHLITFGIPAVVRRA